MLRMLVLLICLFVPLGCSEDTAPTPFNGDPRAVEVVATSYPLRFFTERISGGLIDVSCPLPADADPSAWQPDQSVIERMQRAPLIVVNGAGYEQWLTTAALPLSRLCNTAAGFESELIAFEAVHHSHGPGGEHSHEGTDPHTWMDPAHAARQAEAISIAMARQWPQHERELRDNYLSLASELAALAARFETLRIATDSARIIASHPAFNYPAKRYGWRLKNIDLPADAAPSPTILESLRARVSSYDGEKVALLFEREPSPEVRNAVSGAASTVRIVVFETAESLTPAREAAGEDYLTIMHANIDRLSSALGVSVPRPLPAVDPTDAKTDSLGTPPQ